ncbi:venom peptide isomerase heavy chain [Halyomorpha halys]|uniref:venom peptide isomerase heavy chain n=1 Tax=Halyomorpha halys TaxID=286706 RepID=UPI0006D52115|nr:tryptase-2 [Halyomorpha halys]
MRAVIVSIFFLSAVLVIALVFFSFAGGQVEPSLKPNATCKFENITGVCKSKDSCFINSTLTKLEPCNEGDLSLICCPDKEEMSNHINLIHINKNVTHNRPKRTIGEKAKQMCKNYKETAITRTKNRGFRDPTYSVKYDCKVEKPLIKGGEAAEEREFPHMVEIAKYIVSGDNAGVVGICGGSIVSPKFVLSAAHCNASEEDSYVIFGTNRKIDSIEPAEFLKFFQDHANSISKVIVHPDYNVKNNINDIALFELLKPFSKYERPICLDTGSSLFNMMVIATGFGRNKEQKYSDVLQKVGLKIVDQSSCREKYKGIPNNAKEISEHHVCAYDEGKDTCGGDSGGPIQIYHSEYQCMFTLIGVTSFGVNCTMNTNFPGVYTKVSDYIEWIEDNVWPS